MGDLVGVGFREWETDRLREDAPDLVELAVTCGDLVELMGMQAPQVEAV